MDPRRSVKVAETLREELDEMINYELSDPRIETKGITEVLLSPDGRKANVRVALSGSARQQQDTIDALNHATSFLRRELGKRLEIFRVPDLNFEPEFSAELGSKVEHLLRRVKKGRPRPDNPSEKKPV
jgi:ribosome-binding factor A